MARYTGPVCRLCRREGVKLHLKGERCLSEKCPVSRRTEPPGERGHRRRKQSEYGRQLREKQKARRTYGVLERQFRRYFREAARREGVTGEELLEILERRLDNVVFRIGLAESRAEARQAVRHGHFSVNGRKVDIPSYQVDEGDVVAVRERSRNRARIKELAEIAKGRSVPDWLGVDLDKLEARVLRRPRREDIDADVEEHLIVELYSR